MRDKLLSLSVSFLTFTVVANVSCSTPMPSVPASTPNAALAVAFPAELDRYIQQVMTTGGIPGMAIAVVRNDSVLVAKGYGVRELGRPERVNSRTLFDIASLAKSFTATAVAMLVDRGVLHWDDPVRRHLPDLVLPSEQLTATTTIRDFLSHRTGLHAANMMWVLTSVDRADVLRRMRYLPATAGFREELVYSNIGYTVAGEAAAAAAGRSYEVLLRELILDPLQLTSTTESYEAVARLENVASPHATIAGVHRPIRRETQRASTAPAGAVHSSVADIARWMRLHLNSGVLDGVRYVSDSVMREMHSVQVRMPTTPAMRAARLVQDTVVGYGLGWQIMDYRGHRLWWHTGNGGGQLAYMALLPDDRLGVVVLVNTWAVPLVHMAILNRIVDTYLGYEPRDWAAETLARLPAIAAARDSFIRAMEAMRTSDAPPLPLQSYVGRYDNPLYGPVFIRRNDSALELQMGEGQVADLEHHGGGTLFTRWRDPLYRENFGSHIDFTIRGDSVISLSTRINRDEFSAVRAAEQAAADSLPWRPSWPGTQMAVISGDPQSAQPFVLRFRMPDNYWICPHTHPVNVRIRVLSGTFLIGSARRVDTTTAHLRVLAAGRAMNVRAGMIHYEGSRGETVIEISGQGPWAIRFLDTEFDPTRSAGRVACRPSRSSEQP